MINKGHFFPFTALTTTGSTVAGSDSDRCPCAESTKTLLSNPTSKTPNLEYLYYFHASIPPVLVVSHSNDEESRCRRL